MKTTTRKSTPPYHNSVFNLQRRKRFRGSHRRLRVRERIWWVFASHDVATSRIARVVVIFFGFFIQREGEGDGCHSIPRWPRKETSRKRARTLADKPCVEHTPFEKFNRAGVDAANDITWCSYYGLQWRFRAQTKFDLFFLCPVSIERKREKKTSSSKLSFLFLRKKEKTH